MKDDKKTIKAVIKILKRDWLAKSCDGYMPLCGSCEALRVIRFLEMHMEL